MGLAEKNVHALDRPSGATLDVVVGQALAVGQAKKDCMFESFSVDRYTIFPV